MKRILDLGPKQLSEPDLKRKLNFSTTLGAFQIMCMADTVAKHGHQRFGTKDIMESAQARAAKTPNLHPKIKKSLEGQINTTFIKQVNALCGHLFHVMGEDGKVIKVGKNLTKKSIFQLRLEIEVKDFLVKAAEAPNVTRMIKNPVNYGLGLSCLPEELQAPKGMVFP